MFHGKTLDLNTDLFPVVFVNNILKKTTLKFFGGNTHYDKWGRRYRLSDTNHIYLHPLVHINKPVILESPNPPPGNINALYPDGSREDIPNIYPDYEKLLSMK